MTKMGQCCRCAQLLVIKTVTPPPRTLSMSRNGTHRWLGRTLLLATALCAAAPRPTIAEERAAGAAQTEVFDAAEAQTAAEHALEQARSAVAKARAEAIAAKQELEAAVATAATNPGTAGQPAPAGKPAAAAPAPPASPEKKRFAASAVANAAAAEIETLKKLIADLKAERRSLLTHLTKAHPLIVDAELRLEEYEAALATLLRKQPKGEPLPPGGTAERVAPPAGVLTAQSDDPANTTPQSTGAAQQVEASLRLEAALSKWESAQQELQSAIDSESSAAERLAAVASQVRSAQASPLGPSPAASEPGAAPPVVAAAPAETPPSEARRSRPLVLAALIIALVVAAVASVKLARATDETVFAGADDAAAELALPVVGVIPAASPSLAYGSIFQRYRTATFLAQMLVAVAIFALVAYCVQNPAMLWQLLRGARS
jgi:hypothetical protein